MPIRPPEKINLENIDEFKKDSLAGKIKVRKNGVVVRNPSSKEFWKSFERRVAKDFRTNRTPLSGMVKSLTNSDTLHPKIYVECKARGGENEMKYYEDFHAKMTGNRIETYEIINTKNGEEIVLFDSVSFFKFMETTELNLKLLNCVTVNKVYRSVLSLFRQTVDRAEIEEKIPVVALKKKNRVGYLIGTSPKYYGELHEILKKGKHGTRERKRGR